MFRLVRCNLERVQEPVRSTSFSAASELRLPSVLDCGWLDRWSLGFGLALGQGQRRALGQGQRRGFNSLETCLILCNYLLDAILS
jgi:hypothetical protein